MLILFKFSLRESYLNIIFYMICIDKSEKKIEYIIFRNIMFSICIFYNGMLFIWWDEEYMFIKIIKI